MRARGWALIDLAKATGLSVRTCCTLQQGQGNVANYTRCCIAFGVPTGLADGNPSGRHLRLARWDDRRLVTILEGDALAELKKLPDRSVHCIVCSPPYFQMKVYAGGPGLGNKSSVGEYLDNLVVIFCECVRVLADTGSLWIVIDDSYDAKGLLQVPALLAQRLRATGLILRQDITWDKMGKGLSSAQDRFRNTSERILWFVKRGRYYFDGKLIRAPHSSNPPNIENLRKRIERAAVLTTDEKATAISECSRLISEGRRFRLILRGDNTKNALAGVRSEASITKSLQRQGFHIILYHADGAMLSSTWYFATESDPVHPCVLPVPLAERCIKATCPPEGVVVDPFAGVASVGVAAKRLGRRFIGIEISPRYVKRAWARIIQTEPDREADVEGFRKTETTWYTDERLLAALDIVDLDPCAPRPGDERKVRARRFLTDEENGKAQSWQNPDGTAASVYMNCPYDDIDAWTDKLLSERGAGNVYKAIACLPDKSPGWFDKLWDAGCAYVKVGRLRFGGRTGSDFNDTALFLFGYSKEEIDALVVRLIACGIKRAKVIRYCEEILQSDAKSG